MGADAPPSPTVAGEFRLARKMFPNSFTKVAAGFRGPGILINRSTIVDLAVYAAWLRGPDISQNIKKIFVKYQKIDYRAFAFSHRHYAADNRTVCDIQHFGPFWVVKIQGGQCLLAPLIKISLAIVHFTRALAHPNGVPLS